MLEHADRRNLFKLPTRLAPAISSKVAVVKQFNPQAVRESVFFYEFLHMGVLVFGWRDSGCVDAVTLGRPHQQRAPAASHVQKTLARLQHQLAADVVQFGLLCPFNGD